MTLGALYILIQATEYVTALESPLQRTGAMAAEILLGVVLLLGNSVACYASRRAHFYPEGIPFRGRTRLPETKAQF